MSDESDMTDESDIEEFAFEHEEVDPITFQAETKSVRALYCDGGSVVSDVNRCCITGVDYVWIFPIVE